MRVLLSLGSNLGDRDENLSAALRALGQFPGIDVTAVSDIYETEPIGKTDQPEFLNLAAEIRTDLDPPALLSAVKEIERELGRVPGEHWGPRLIDIDLILWGLRTFDSKELTLPHREFRKRAFVLTPLAEIAPDTVDPMTGLTVAELAARTEARGRVVRRGALPGYTVQ